MHDGSNRAPCWPARHLFGVRRSGMTLIELLIVIVIIAILVGAVMVASTSLIGKSKSRNTQSVLQIVADAAEQFKRTETEKPALTRHARYKARYGHYPPDELEVFTPAGVPGPPSLPPTGNLAVPTGSSIFPATNPFPSMRFYTNGTDDDKEHRDLAALIVAIESQGGEAAAVLDRITDRNRSAGYLDPGTKNPGQYLSRPTGINATSVNNDWGAEDLQIRYILDDWGIPISYMSQRDFVHDGPNPVPSSNHEAWNEASTELVRLNGGQPIIFSYGPNGKDQLTADAMGTEGKVSLIGDFEFNEDHVVNDPFNDDNVYINDQLREKLAKGIEQHAGP